MSILRETTFTVSGTVTETDFANQKVTVSTFQGYKYPNVPVASQYLCGSDASGFHAFPKVGDFCKLTRDITGWFVSEFVSAFDPTGAYLTARPSLYRAGSIHMSSDLSTVDVLPTPKDANGKQVFATQKYGVTLEAPVHDASFCNVPASSTTLVNPPSYSLINILKRGFPFDICSEIASSTAPIATAAPRVTSIDVGAVLVDTAIGTVTPQTITVSFENVQEIFKNGKFVPGNPSGDPPVPDTQGAVLIISGLQTNFYTLVSVPSYNSSNNTTSGPATFTISVSSALPSGVYDLTFFNTGNGASVVATAGLCVHSFIEGNFVKTYFTTGDNTIGFTDPSVISEASLPSNIGLVFTVGEGTGTIIQELDKLNATDANSKYVGVTDGPFNDFVGLFDPSGTNVLDFSGSTTLDKFRTCSENISGSNTTLLSQLTATITAVVPLPSFTDPNPTGRLTASIEATEFNIGDIERHNVGIRVSNFTENDKFRISVFRNIPKVKPDYSLNPRLDSMTPSSFYAPVTSAQVQLNGEDIRYGSTYILVRNTQITNQGLITEAYVPITGDKARMDLGSDALGTSKSLQFTGADGTFPAPSGEIITGTVRVVRVSDTTVGFTFIITGFSNTVTPTVAPYGDYDIIVKHPNQPSDETKVAAIRIVPKVTSNTSGTTSPNISSANNVVLQKVIERTSSDVTKFTYAVDDQGRCDITTSAGFYINGTAITSGTSIAGTIGVSRQNIEFATEVGDGALITEDGSIFIAAYRKNNSDPTKGNIHMFAENCFSAAQDAVECFVGRRAGTAQFGTHAPEVHLGGLALPMAKKFPVNAVSTALVITEGSSLTSVGPLLVPDDSYEFAGQLFSEVVPTGTTGGTIATTAAGFAGARFALRSRATTPAGFLIEGNIELVFVPDGNGFGTEAQPFTGSWHIPLA